MEDKNENNSQLLSEPPLDLLFNPTLVGKKNVWEINISKLLDLLLNVVSSSGNPDLRICGIAAWSSSLIYRLKVESIFKLEKIALEKKSIDQEKDIPEIDLIDFPFRLNSTYPVSIEDLFKVLEKMISEMANPKPRKNISIQLEPLEDFDFDQYLIKFEQILEEHEELILYSLQRLDQITFNELTKKMSQLEVARTFIALLHLAMKDKIHILQDQTSYDILIQKNKINVNK
ncbi:MAG: chromosome segregation protein ScpA [Nitrososphaeraceae archaeon]